MKNRTYLAGYRRAYTWANYSVYGYAYSMSCALELEAENEHVHPDYLRGLRDGAFMGARDKNSR